jgi:outer membrane protein OmpA-like peptidoglycan-associated protein
MLITRFPGSKIDSCSDKPDDAADMKLGNQNKRVEGEVQTLDYSTPKGTTQAQLIRNIKTALQTAGFTLDYQSSTGDLWFHKSRTWVAELTRMSGESYSQKIVIETALKQEMFADAAALSSGINGSGHVVATGILFDTGKSEVKAESAPALQEIAKLLQQNSGLKIYVVGHTDNVGSLGANMTLSQQRASAVVRELTTRYGVAAARLQPYGDGPYAPVASNDSDTGRVQNRRVELVKQ